MSVELGRRPVLALLASAAFAGAARAGEVARAPYRWRSVKVGGGGFIPGIVFSQVEAGLAYARSDMGGAYRWSAADGTWTPLQDGMAESSYQGVESIAPDPVDANVVYMACGMYRGEPSAIMRSRDRGRTWAIFPTAFRMGGNEDARGLGERLAVDPNDPAVLYFGSRHDGLQRSRDHGASWSRVESFPHRGLGLPPREGPTNAGIAFVLFDAGSGRRGRPTPRLIAGVADEAAAGLYLSEDAGKSWRRLGGEPRAGLVPVKAEIDDAGVVYSAWCKGVGPNGVTDGAVFKIDTHNGGWTDITPDKRADRPQGGYMGISLDRSRPGTLLVATMNRWRPDGDTLWRSTDGGETWRDIGPRTRRDVSATPFLYWGEPEADRGWWMAALAIDPFDSDFAAYATGATIYATRELTRADHEQPTGWRPWVEGIEQTAILTLVSPPSGPPLLSGFGDISGFAHQDLGVSPTAQFTTPVFANTNVIDYAGMAPHIVVRSGTVPHRGEETDPTLAWSQDGGLSWRPLRAERHADAGPIEVIDRGRRRRIDPFAEAAIAVNADGEVLCVMTPTAQISRDRGAAWTAVRGLPRFARPVFDRVDPLSAYALDFETGTLFASRDGGATFQPAGGRAPPSPRPVWREAPWPLHATPGRAGQLWLVSERGLFRSTDGGAAFRRVDADIAVDQLSFGKAPPGRDHPALFAIGRRGAEKAVYRSDDGGRRWLRINGPDSEYGRRFRCIAGDPRVYGRVYLGTDGRGVLYGEPA